MSTSYPLGAAPFDAVAPRYDETFTASSIGRIQRAAVWNVLAKTFRPGDQVIEIGCGTGVDACFLAERGVRVMACDSSERMLEVARRRVQESGHDHLVRSRWLRAEDIGVFVGTEFFDGAFSNFGVLNCLDAQAISGLARDLARILKPDAGILLCWMGPCCLWETLWYVAHGNFEKAFRRLRRSGMTARIENGTFFDVRYPSVRSVVQAFAPEFQLKSVQGIGLTVPPSYVEGWARHHPKLLDLLAKLDTVLTRCPGIRLLADHILVRFERTSLAQKS